MMKLSNYGRVTVLAGKALEKGQARSVEQRTPTDIKNEVTLGCSNAEPSVFGGPRVWIRFLYPEFRTLIFGPLVVETI